MNAGNGGGKGPMQRAGKEFVIVIVVVFSSLSFTLGFFVGKKSAGSGPDHFSQSLTQPQETDRGRQNAPPEEMPPAAVAAVPGRDGSVSRQPGKPDGHRPSPMENSAGTAVLPAPEMEAPRPAEGAKREESASPQTKGTEAEKAVTIYSVQLGALKSRAEARRMRDVYTKKGYVAYITVVSGKRKEKIYKVKAGKFSDRKEAELLSIKLKKNGDLQAFVTGANE